MEAIKARKRPPQKGDDILLSVINDGRHAAIDPRFVVETPERSALEAEQDGRQRRPDLAAKQPNTQFYDPARISRSRSFRGPATQMIFANLGVNGRGPMAFPPTSGSRKRLRSEGVPAERDRVHRRLPGRRCRGRRLFNDINDGKVRILVGSTQKMGTGVNAQRRLLCPSQPRPTLVPGRRRTEGRAHPKPGQP